MEALKLALNIVSEFNSKNMNITLPKLLERYNAGKRNFTGLKLPGDEPILVFKKFPMVFFLKKPTPVACV